MRPTPAPRKFFRQRQPWRLSLMFLCIRTSLRPLSRLIPYAKKHHLFDAKIIAAHCVHIDEGEIRTLHQYHAGVAHNPSSNLKLASGFAPVNTMLEVGLNVGIGTDGPASNNDLDMFEEVRLASFIAKATTGDPTVLPRKPRSLWLRASARKHCI